MLESIQSYIDTCRQSTKSFNQHFAEYMMEVQDRSINIELSRLFDSTSFEKLVALDKESDKIHKQLLKGT